MVFVSALPVLQQALAEPHQNNSCSNSVLLTLSLNLLQNEDAAVYSSSRRLDSQTFLDTDNKLLIIPLCWNLALENTLKFHMKSFKVYFKV